MSQNVHSLKKISNNFLLFAIFFVLLLIIGFLSQYHFYQYNFFFKTLAPSYLDFLRSLVPELIKKFGSSDNGTYLNMALHFSEFGKFPPYLILGWPPGFPFLLAMLAKLTGIAAFPLKMMILICALWSAALVTIYRTLPTTYSVGLKILLVFLPFYLVSFRSWIFGFWIFFSEEFALPLFVIAVCLFIFWLRTNKTLYLISFAICMALLAYLRGFFESLGNFLICLLILTIIVQFVWQFIVKKIERRNSTVWQCLRQSWDARKNIFTSRYRACLIASLIFIILLSPWRIHNRLISNTYAWLPTGGYNWLLLWTPSDKFHPMYREAAPNPPCHLKPKICQILYTNDVSLVNPYFQDIKFYRNLSIMTALSYPLRWYGYKLKYINGFWFGFGATSWQQLIKSEPWLFIEGLLIFVVGAGTIIFGITQWENLTFEQRGILSFTLLFLIFNIIVFTFVHYEPRYSLFLRLLFWYLPVWIFANKKLIQF
jgi:hypothetical protein